MYKGKATITIIINMNIPENTDGLLPYEEISNNITQLDKEIQSLLDEYVLCPEDGITGEAILEEAYLDVIEDGGDEDA